MKKVKPTLLAVTVIAMMTTIFNACKKDKASPTDITGKWIYETPYQNTQVYQEIYQFNADSTFSQTRIIAESGSGQAVAYQYIATGKFRLNNDQLRLYSISAKYNSKYVPIDQLVPSATPIADISYTVAIQNDRSSFHFVFKPCGPSENCIGEIPYYRK